MLSYAKNRDLYLRRLTSWHNILTDGARQLSGHEGQQDGQASKTQIWYMSQLDSCLRLGRRDGSTLPDGEFDIATFRLGPKPSEPWLVQINFPTATEQGNTRLAHEANGSGRIWLIRRGRLQKNGATPAISEDEFRDRAEPDQVQTYDGDSRDSRAWYKVAMLDGQPAEIRAQTKEFLMICRDIRAGYEGEAIEPDASGGPQEAPPDETRSSYNVSPEASRLVHQRQAKVLDRLLERLRAVGVRSVKMQNKGFACDLLLRVEPKAILIEIKTGTLASDIYTGVGQLILYPRRLDLQEPIRRVLLLPSPSRSDLLDDVRAQGIEVGFYRLQGNWSDSKPLIEFLPEFCRICGIP